MIIGITGKKGSGKSSIGDYIAENYDYTVMNWADPLKAAVSAFFGITPEQEKEMKNDPTCIISISTEYNKNMQNITLRKFEQILGTQVGREIFGEDHWVNILDDRYTYGEAQQIVIPDCRFPNEVAWVKDHKGIIINVIRPHLDSDDTHESEIHEFEYDYQINNSHASLSWLYSDVDAIMGMISLK